MAAELVCVARRARAPFDTMIESWPRNGEVDTRDLCESFGCVSFGGDSFYEFLFDNINDKLWDQYHHRRPFAGVAAVSAAAAASCGHREELK